MVSSSRLCSASSSIHLHPVPPAHKSGERRHLITTAFVLAVAELHTIRGVSSRIHVRLFKAQCCSLSLSRVILVVRLCLSILFLIFGRLPLFVDLLGFVALGLESTLPIPQLVRFVQPHSGFHTSAAEITSQQLQAEVPLWFPHVYPDRLGWRRFFQVCSHSYTS